MDDDEWLSANDALQTLTAHMPDARASSLIVTRAFAGMVAARAQRFIFLGVAQDDYDIPTEFWEGADAFFFKKDWMTGDFAKAIRLNYHDPVAQVYVYGVSFKRSDIERLAASWPVQRSVEDDTANASDPNRNPGGRPPKTWWDDMWIDIARQLYAGDLKPDRQADIERAMTDWVTDNGHDASPATIKPRAAKLWRALQADDKN
ncbi:hypothetical protein OSJ57_21450 [Sphingomonas sp. HH69]